MSAVIYCSHPHIDNSIKTFCLERLKRQASEGKHQFVHIEQEADKPLHINSFYSNILKGIRKAKGQTVFLVDHDVLYPDGYFEQTAKADISYCKNVFYLTPTGYLLRKFNYAPMSTLIANKNVLKAGVKRKMKMEAIRWFEIGIEDPEYKGEIEYREYPQPVVDIRHENCFTKHKQVFEGGAESLEPYGKAVDIWEAIKKCTQVGHKALTDEKPVNVIAENVNHGSYSKPEISIIITAKNEELLGWTIDNIRRTTKGYNLELIIGFDGWQAPQYVKQASKADSYFFTGADCCGVGRSRDLAICKAKGEYLVIMDAHMDFNQNNWLDLLLEPVRKDSKVLSCSRSVVMSGDCLNMNKAGLTIRHGARLPIAHENMRRIPLDPVWLTDRPAGEIQCILGACYGLKRQRYFDIHRPWEYAVGWGSSEQVISVINWFFGGSCWLTDAVSGHLYRTQSDAMERRSTNITVPGMFYNRLRLFCLMPMAENIRRKLIECVLNRSDAIKCKDRILSFINMRPDRKLEDAIKATGKTFEDYVKAFYPPDELESLMKDNLKPVIENKQAIIPKPISKPVFKNIQLVQLPESKFINNNEDRRFV